MRSEVALKAYIDKWRNDECVSFSISLYFVWAQCKFQNTTLGMVPGAGVHEN